MAGPGPRGNHPPGAAAGMWHEALDGEWPTEYDQDVGLVGHVQGVEWVAGRKPGSMGLAAESASDSPPAAPDTRR